MCVVKQYEKLDSLVDKSFDWVKIRDKYTPEQLNEMPYWLNNEKLKEETGRIMLQEPIDITKLNKYQRFTFDLVQHFTDKNKQLLMILLGKLI